MSRPDAICIGTYKCATTWLFDVLSQHPDIFTPDFKEVHFFSETHGDGLWEKRDLEWYSRLYEAAKPGQVRVEFSPGYMIEPAVAERIREHVGTPRLLGVFRDPVARVHSHFHYLNEGKFPLPYSLDEIIADPDRCDPPGRRNILRHGLYAKNLQPFIDVFGREAVHVVFQEEIDSDPDRVIGGLLEFLGVGPFPGKVDLAKRVNEAQALRSRQVYWFQYNVARTLERMGLSWGRRAIKATGLPELVRRLNTREFSKPALTAAQASGLRDFYRSDIEKLSDIVGRDLGQLWRADADRLSGGGPA